MTDLSATALYGLFTPRAGGLAPEKNALAEKAPETSFLEFMAKSTEQKMHELMLKEKGMTEEEYAALPPDERAKIDAEIRERIKAEAEKRVGIIGA